MKIQRFQGADMRSAIRKVRDALGPDAVILSNQRIEEGVEIVAAIDYDESLLAGSVETSPTNTSTHSSAAITDEEHERQQALDDIKYGRNIPQPTFEVPEFTPSQASSAAAPEPASHIWTEQPTIMEMQNELKSLRGLLVNQLSGLAWGNETRYHPMRARLLQRLLAMGTSPSLAKQVSEQCDEQDGFDFNWRKMLGLLAHMLPVAENDILNKGGVIALVGATGVGKTTTIAKLAARYTLRHGQQSVALITTDNYRVAAHEQLRSYARIMGVPMRIAADENSLRDALAGFNDKGLVLIDTAGMSQRDMELSQQLMLLNSGGRPVQTYLTMATNSQRGVLQEVTIAFKEIELSGCILTKVDETTSLGGALSVAVEQALPIAYISDGQRVPEDLHPARAHSLVSRSVAIMQQVAAGHKDEDVSLALGGMVASAHG